MKSKTGKPQKIELYVCQGCDQPILPSKGKHPNGFIIHGNVYAAEPERGGMIGDNFPTGTQLDDNGKFGRDNVIESVFCRTCLTKTLGLGDFEDMGEEVEEENLWIIASKHRKKLSRMYYAGDGEWCNSVRGAKRFSRSEALESVEDVDKPDEGYTIPNIMPLSGT